MKKLIIFYSTIIFATKIAAQNLPYSISSKEIINIKETRLPENLKLKTKAQSHIKNKIEADGGTDSTIKFNNLNRIDNTKDSLMDDRGKSFNDFTDNLNIQFYLLKRNYIYSRDTVLLNLLKHPDNSALYNQLKKIKDKYAIDLMLLEKVKDTGFVFDNYEAKTRSDRTFFPAIFARDAADIYNEDTGSTRRFFSNNEIILQTVNKSITYSTEIYSDFIGPFRIGFGVLINSASNDTSTSLQKNQTTEIQKLSAGGGNGQVSLRFPLIKPIGTNKMIKIRSSLMAKINFDIPPLNNPSTAFNANIALGTEAFWYTKSMFNIINFFGAYRGMYYWGNKNFNESLKGMMGNSFWMNYISVGVAIKNDYRVRVDFYTGNSFIKQNFPATITFSTSISK